MAWEGKKGRHNFCDYCRERLTDSQGIQSMFLIHTKPAVPVSQFWKFPGFFHFLSRATVGIKSVVGSPSRDLLGGLECGDHR